MVGQEVGRIVLPRHLLDGHLPAAYLVLSPELFDREVLDLPGPSSFNHTHGGAGVRLQLERLRTKRLGQTFRNRR